MQIGVDSFVATAKEGKVGDAERIRDLLEEIELADQVGLDVFGLGEHHRPDYLSSAPAVLLAAAAGHVAEVIGASCSAASPSGKRLSDAERLDAAEVLRELAVEVAELQQRVEGGEA